MVNEQLRYAIAVLKGNKFKTYPRNRVYWVLGVIEDMERFGWLWQARILRSHLNRYISLQAPRGEEPDLLSEEGEEEISSYTLGRIP